MPCVSVLLIPSRPENDQLRCKLLWVKNSSPEHLPVLLITIYTVPAICATISNQSAATCRLLSSCPAPALIWWGQGQGAHTAPGSLYESKLLSVDCFRRRGSLCLIKAERVILFPVPSSRISYVVSQYRVDIWSIECTLDLDVCNALYNWQCMLQIIIAALGLAGS